MYLYHSDYVNDFTYLKMGDFASGERAQSNIEVNQTISGIEYSKQVMELLAP